MITINNLDVRFDVTGSDEEVFAELFQKFMRRWSDLDEQRRKLDQQAAGDRSLGDEANPEGQPWA